MPLSRRHLLTLSGAAAFSGLAPGWARANAAGVAGGADVLSGETIALEVAHSALRIAGKTGHAVTINGKSPAPLIRLREGQNVKLQVTNRLQEDTSIHWHGLIVPFQFDGVPGISFPGIAPGETFTYDFPIKQAGTYWYHSHSNMQEAMGLYGPIVIDPAQPDPIIAEREHILVLSDWSFLHPHEVLRRLKQKGGYYNRQKQTLSGLVRGEDQGLAERLMWAQMRMDPTDISDVTGSIYRYVINGHVSEDKPRFAFATGERVRLRIINASAMTNFNFRIPGLAMTIVQADGLPVAPVETDEFQIAVAETYDVILTPDAAQSYAIVAEALDRSGLCHATLSAQPDAFVAAPPLRKRPLLSMRDMGMGGMEMANTASGELDLSKPVQPDAAMSHHGMKMRDQAAAPEVKLNPGVEMLAAAPVDRLGDRPTGLEDESHRVLTYRDLRAAEKNPDVRQPTRTIQLHLTSNMERYMWSFDGVKFSEGVEPIALKYGERLRMTLINDTMMPHPIHLHGHFFELVTGEDDDAHKPRKHTVNVLPGGKVSFDVTADALGDWAFHCHMLMHMHSGMFRIVSTRKAEEGQ